LYFNHNSIPITNNNIDTPSSLHVKVYWNLDFWEKLNNCGIGFFIWCIVCVCVFVFVSFCNLDCGHLSVHFKEHLQNLKIQFWSKWVD
jgi:hypothetical protein